MKKCLLVGSGSRAGTLPPAGEAMYTVAVDGGYDWLLAWGRPVDLVIGDFDSVSAPPAHSNVVRLPREKDDTDMLAGIKAAQAAGCDTFYIYGGTGGRFDHTLGNVQALMYLASLGQRGFLVGDGFTAECVTNGCLTLPARPSGLVSVFSMGGTAQGAVIEGLKYALPGDTMAGDYPNGVSNEFIGKPARIGARRGTMLVVYESGKGADPSCGTR